MAIIKYDLIKLAREAMLAHGLTPDISDEALLQLASISAPRQPSRQTKDLQHFLWHSIDNDDSRDLDQVTYAERSSNSEATIYIAIADVDSLVEKNSALDHQAQINTTSVYTPAKTFPMLPEKLSTNLTSLNEREGRLAIVISMIISSQGEIRNVDHFIAVVNNQAKLTYNEVGQWLEKKGEIPKKIADVPGMIEVILLENDLAQTLKQNRHKQGSLTLRPLEYMPLIENDVVIGMISEVHNLAHELIENFMIAANVSTAIFLKKNQIPSLFRVVKIPKNWDLIVELAAKFNEKLPSQPNSQALEQFLISQQSKNPDQFPDISLSVIKLLGNGEYIVLNPKDPPIGHFGLALKEYIHSTAPNRRYPDVITQRQLKAHLSNACLPYGLEELGFLALHCTQQEDAATKVERQLRKSAAAVLLSSQIGAVFVGIVSGAGEKGTWIRILDPPVEGKIVQKFEGLNVGDKIKVVLISVDVEKGFIDFKAI